MKSDTPLTEVVRHLPREAAAYLLDQDVAIQTAVLIQVRDLIVFWETRGYTFDPIAYEGILNAIVPTLAPLYCKVQSLGRQSAELALQLATADNLIQNLSEAIAKMSREAPDS